MTEDQSQSSQDILKLHHDDPGFDEETKALLGGSGPIPNATQGILRVRADGRAISFTLNDFAWNSIVGDGPCPASGDGTYHGNNIKITDFLTSGSFKLKLTKTDAALELYHSGRLVGKYSGSGNETGMDGTWTGNWKTMIRDPRLPPGIRIRRDIRELEYEYNHGNRKPLETLIRAFRGVAAIPPGDPSGNSFFDIAGYHGMPFRGAGWGNAAWWGGYCNHGNVLFPVWHRAYCLRLEDALRSIEGCSDVTLPYWNEIDDETEKNGLPLIFLTKTFTIDNETFPNPLYSYKFAAGVYDNLAPIPDADYTKPLGYETVRYPFSGLVGPNDKAATDAHNATMTSLGEDVTNKYLNDNVKGWLDYSITNHEGKVIPTGARDKYLKCLDAPNYTVFSNTTSATQYNEDNFSAPSSTDAAIVPLESPHNDMHLAIGGYEVPGIDDVDTIAGANGDMGENDTAGFDPIFFFHHCFVDKMFWTWQTRWGKTHHLDVIPHYPGTNSVDSQGPTPGVAGNIWLDMNSPLDPFKKNGQTMTGNDVANIHKLGYAYSLFFVPQLPTPRMPVPPTPTLRVTGVNRAEIAGSFLVSTWAKLDANTEKKLVHVESVLSRWHVEGCANCGTHLNVKSFVPLHGWTMEAAKKAEFDVLVHTRKSPKGERHTPKGREIKPVLGAI